MNPESTDRRDADALDAFWDELVLGQLSGSTPDAASSNEEMVMNLQRFVSPQDDGAAIRLRRLVFGTAPGPALVAGPVRPAPAPRPEPIRPTWSIRKYSQLVAAALVVVLVGALIAVLSAGIFSNRGGGNKGSTVIPAAVSRIDATPAALASPIVANNGIVWTLPFEGANVEIGAIALADGALYRLIRSDQFTGVQAVDTATGTEKWRSAQEWSGTGMGADQTGVYFLTAGEVRALDASSGEQIWNIGTLVAPNSLTLGGSRLYLWDGRSELLAIEARNGDVVWKAVADAATQTTAARSSQPPVVTEHGIAAVSGTSAIALFDIDGNFTGTAGLLDPATVELAATASGDIAIAGAPRLETNRPWARKLLLVDPGDGSTIWETDYNALVTGLTVTDKMAFVLADNPGMAYSATNDDIPYPQQTSPQIYAHDLSTGQVYAAPDSNQEGKRHEWVTDKGLSPYVALATGPTGPIAISESDQLAFYSIENPLVQAVVSLPGVRANEIAMDDNAVYASTDDGAVTAIAPVLAGLEPQSYSNSSLNWTMPPAGQLVDFGGMAYSNGLVYRLIDTGSGQQIETTFASTGQPAWALPFDWSTDQLVADPGPDPYDPPQTWTGSGNIFAVDVENRLIAIEGATGTFDWQHTFANPVVSFVYDADTLYIWDESGTMTALLPQDGMVLWSTTPGDASGPQNNEFGQPIPTATRTTIAMVDANGTLHGFSKELGTLLWSTPGFDGTNTRLVHQGLAESGQQEWFVVLTAHGDPDANGSFELVLSGVLAQTGERRWDDYLTGPLAQPVATNETMVFAIGNEAMTGKAVTPSDPIVDSESYNHYVWTGSGEAAPAGGGHRLFAFDVDTGQIVWICTTAAGGFTSLSTKFPNSGALTAVTTDGLLVRPTRDNGSIDGEPAQLGGPVIAILSSGETGATGSFATLAGGTLVAFGGMPFSQQG